MRGAVIPEPFRVELVEREPAQPRSDEVLIRVEQCGVCTSELDLWAGLAPERLPADIGHEFGGTVTEVGRQVHGLRPGDRVAAWMPGGGFAEDAVAREAHCVAVGDLPFPSIAEPLSGVLNAIDATAPAVGDDVVIVGAGFMGNLVQQVMAHRGPRTLTLADVRADALRRAERFGATHVVDTGTASLAKAVGEITEGRGADVTFEVTGDGEALVDAGDVTRVGGRLCIVGYHQGGLRSVPLADWNARGLKLVNGHIKEMDTIMRGMGAAVRIVAAGMVDVPSLMTHRFPLEQIGDAFQRAFDKPDGFVKAIVDIDGPGDERALRGLASWDAP